MAKRAACVALTRNWLWIMIIEPERSGTLCADATTSLSGSFKMTRDCYVLPPTTSRDIGDEMPRRMGGMTVPVWLQLLLYALAVTRLTGLLIADTITEGARTALIEWLDDRPRTLGSFIAGALDCPWCVGMWVSLAAAPLVWFYGDSPVMLIPALALAFSQVTGATANLGR